MKRSILLASCAALALAPAAALAQSRSQAVITIDKSGPCRAITPYNPATGNAPPIGCIDGADRFVMPSGVAIAGQTEVESLAALQALPAAQVTAGTRARRRGYAAAGDGGAADYVYSATACSRNGGDGDGGAQVKPSFGSGCWTIVPGATGLTPALFGAKCDAVTDDTLALRRLFGAMTSRVTVTIAGTCAFSDQLTLPVDLYDVTIDAALGGTLLYIGASTTLDPVIRFAEGGHDVCKGQGWRVKGLRLISNTVMTAGAALHAGDLCRAQFDGLIIGDNSSGGFLGSGNGNWYDALEVAGGNTIVFNALVARAQRNSIRAHGDASSKLIDITFNDTKSFGAKYGINVSGNVGGIMIGSGGGYLANSESNVRISQDDVALPNSQVFIDQGPVDGTTGVGIGVDVVDPGNINGSYLIMTGTWLSFAQSQCMVVRSSALYWTIQITGGQIITCGQSGTMPNAAFDNQSTSPGVHIAMSGVIFRQNLNQKNIYNIAGANPIALQGVHFLDAGIGSINGAWSGSVVDNTGALRMSAPTLAQVKSVSGNVLITPGPGKYVCIGNGGEVATWFGNGSMIPGDGACSTAGGASDIGTASYPFNVARLNTVVSIGARPAWSGCPTGSPAGGVGAGAFTLTAACTGTLTMTYGAVPTGWACDLQDLTTPAATIKQSGYTASTASFSVSGALSGDRIVYKCTGL